MIAVSVLIALVFCPLAQTGAAESPPNRIEVILLGTGYPRPDPNRAGPFHRRVR
jgi:hypothetical protein